MSYDLEKQYIQVAVSLPISGTFTYSVGGTLAGKTEAGKRVLVPFSKQRVIGYILRIIPAEERKGVKDIISVVDPHPLFPQDMVEFFEWLSSYYHYPIGLVIKAALPTGLNVAVRGSQEISDKGWQDRVGLLKRVFVTVKRGAHIDSSLFDRDRAPGNESGFLELLHTKRELPLGEITRKFPNGRYLVDKWIKKGVLKKSLKPVVRDVAGEMSA